MTALLIALGGAAGAVARFWIDHRLRRTGRLPRATFLVNVAGSFVLGALTSAVAHGIVGAPLGAALGTGFCGAFTTFSSLSYETVTLIERRRRGAAALYSLATVSAGLSAAAAGWALIGPVS